MLALATDYIGFIDLMTCFHLFLNRIDRLEIKGCVCVARTFPPFLFKLHFPLLFLFSLSKGGFGKHCNYYGKYGSCHPVIRSLLWCMG